MINRQDFIELTYLQCRKLLDEANINYYTGSSLFWLQEAVYQEVKKNIIDYDKVIQLILEV